MEQGKKLEGKCLLFLTRKPIYSYFKVTFDIAPANNFDKDISFLLKTPVNFEAQDRAVINQVHYSPNWLILRGLSVGDYRNKYVPIAIKAY